MADKLTEAHWSAVRKRLKLDLDDRALLKSLSLCEKAAPGSRAKALQEVVRQVDDHAKALTRRKKELGDKTFGERAGRRASRASGAVAGRARGTARCRSKAGRPSCFPATRPRSRDWRRTS